MSRITEKIPLPSNGKIYPKKDVTIQNMTVKEEKFLYGSTSDKAIDQILKGCITDKDVDLDQLIVPDKHYILVRLRVLTYGEDYPVELTCPRCRSKFTETVKLSNLEVDELPEDFKEPWKITLPVSKDELELHIPRNHEISEYNDLARKKADRFKLNFEEVSYIFRTMLGVTSVNGDEMVTDELYEYISELNARDASYLKKQFSDIRVGYYTRLSCDCPQCRSRVDFRLPMTSDFFLATFDD